jgi:transcription antitermination factor NusG
MGSISKFKGEDRVRILTGPFARKIGTVKDLLPDAYGVKVGSKMHWFMKGDQLEHVTPRKRD